ncbi:alpha-1,4-glucan:maltose-1-phosphate maltosyltransferase [Nitrosomonas aestuarii]|uniref:Alpha-1,4-glucan:maltose-1-phosphate maltosyltransferase n=1 Tax=Nitrosomonas aestuarii TaxID=52441 RepID=A0A1I4BWL5_9PROT|nr:alpha-1,4-glucan--maltose-1-phosphate maltosyltransferase [Nitrosomonas aestuarii]SFK72406.1 alpha-1,4-glucan:maltose-1-phosphate maltosyltransferase [Nitrosomonas aestuarii]
MVHNLPKEGRRRVVVERVMPQINGGRFPIKRTVGESVVVEADVFTDGHDHIQCQLQYRNENSAQWHTVLMKPLGNDRWQGSFPVRDLGRYLYTVAARIDHFLSWRHDLTRRIEPEDIDIALLVGAELIEAAARHASGEDAKKLQQAARILNDNDDRHTRMDVAMGEELAQLMARNADLLLATVYDHTLVVVVDPELARFGAWYETFPRSCSEQSDCHGTFADCEARLPYIAEMGFDVLYLPPIHPIGHTKRKGRNNTLIAYESDTGSPWAIGSKEGGHLSVHPELGTLGEFRSLVTRARDHGLEIALDIAFQCSPDHPYVTEHPAWFRHRPDGSVQYAENPPKKYEDIYPFDFETADWQGLWVELEDVFRFWIEQGVRIFRVDNPHTKSFYFWEWLIANIKRDHPETIFLAEAFTRPKVLHYLAKLGFSQSYNYFPWRNTKHELTEYLVQLAHGPEREYLRPNLWPNTPDILTEYLQFGGRPAFMIRLALAATLGASYGIYGPAFELFENTPRKPGSEEYLNSEKYQIRNWELNRHDSLKDYVARINRIRKENPALQHNRTLQFQSVDNDSLICYSKTTEDLTNIVLVVVNLDPHHTQSGWVDIPLDTFGLEAGRSYQVHDLLSNARFIWNGPRNYVELQPHVVPAHIFRLRRRVRSEQDFDYYL